MQSNIQSHTDSVLITRYDLERIKDLHFTNP